MAAHRSEEEHKAMSGNKKKKERTEKKQSSADQYIPSDEVHVGSKAYKICETKNIPKNFGKAILRFIKKNESLTFEVINEYNYNYKKFHLMINLYKNKINTIAELRSLWMDEEN